MSPLHRKPHKGLLRPASFPTHPPKRREEAWGLGVRQGQESQASQEAAGSSENQGSATHGVEVPGALGRLSGTGQVGQGKQDCWVPAWLCSRLPE